MTSRWVGEYEVVKRLSVGGMATLYLARRHGAAGFSRLVALKVVHPHLVEQSTFVDMFVDEARICAQISHPNVVHVEEFGETDGLHYLVMEYIDGCSVADLLRLFRREGRQLEPELAARLIMQVAAGLHAAHETLDQEGAALEIVHRDISPSNILLSVDGNAKLIDFGIAKARNRLSQTEAGVALKGKYKYIAPEQATRATVDRRSDIFSLGAVFWELLVGQPLFPDESHSALVDRLERTVVRRPSAVNPDALVILDSIVLAMLQHDPVDRPQTAAEVQRRIATALPSAANRDAAELGAIAIEVRDKRAARHSASGDNLDHDASLSPTSRSGRSRRDSYVAYEPHPSPAPPGAPVDALSIAASGALSAVPRGALSIAASGALAIPPPDAASVAPPAPRSDPSIAPPIPHTPAPTVPDRPRWLRRGTAVQLGVVGMLAFGVMLGVLTGRRSSPPGPPVHAQPEPSAAASNQPPLGAEHELQPRAPAPDPATAPSPVESSGAKAEVESSGAEPEAETETETEPEPEIDATEGSEGDAKPRVTRSVTAATVAAPGAADASARRPPGRPAAKQDLPQRGATGSSEQPRPTPARAAAPRKAETPFAEIPFDEPSNRSIEPGAPSHTKVKNTPIVTDFGN
jgi:serine/threonine-protein kinase